MVCPYEELLCVNNLNLIKISLSELGVSLKKVAIQCALFYFSVFHYLDPHILQW